MKKTRCFHRLFLSAVLIACYLAGFSTNFVFAESELTKPQAIKQLSSLINEELADEEIGGISISVIHGQSTWYSNGFGYADIEDEVEATAKTQYRIGAISSIFTAMLVLKLEQNGLLKLADPISKYLPNLPFKTHNGKKYSITIKQLLTHHSGLPLSVLKDSWSEAPEDFKQLFSSDRTIYLSQQPDTIYTYSNLGYSLLGLLIEKLTNLSFEQAIEKHLLNPMGMNQSYISKPSNKSKTLAKGYRKGEEKEYLYPRDLPSLGLVTNANDMALFVKQLFAIVNGSSGILSKKQINKMLRIQNNHVAADLGKKVGLAWMVSGMDIKGGGQIFWRGGASLYHRSRIVLLPEKQIGVVVLANEAKAWESTEKVSEKAIKLILETELSIQQPGEQEVEMSGVEPYGIKDNFAPHYSSFLGFIPITTGANSIKAELLGWTVIAKVDEFGWYDLQYDLFGFIPIDISWITEIKVRPAKINDIRVLIVLYKGTQHLFASHMELPDASPAWTNRLGEYRLANSDNLTETMEIESGELVVENNKLFFLYELPMFLSMELKVPLKVINRDMAIIPGMGTALNEVVLVKKNGKKELLEFSGYLLEQD